MADLEPAAAGRALKMGAWRAMEEIEECSHDSEHDLAFMVSDFLENWSYGSGSRCSSDSESGYYDLSHVGDKISVCFPPPKGSSFSSLSISNLFIWWHCLCHSSNNGILGNFNHSYYFGGVGSQLESTLSLLDEDNKCAFAASPFCFNLFLGLSWPI